MFYNRNASLMKRVLNGHFADALQEFQTGPAQADASWHSYSSVTVPGAARELDRRGPPGTIEPCPAVSE
jgi:hypothetical protein